MQIWLEILNEINQSIADQYTIIVSLVKKSYRLYDFRYFGNCVELRPFGRNCAPNFFLNAIKREMKINCLEFNETYADKKVRLIWRRKMKLIMNWNTTKSASIISSQCPINRTDQRCQRNIWYTNCIRQNLTRICLEMASYIEESYEYLRSWHCYALTLSIALLTLIHTLTCHTRICIWAAHKFYLIRCVPSSVQSLKLHTPKIPFNLSC